MSIRDKIERMVFGASAAEAVEMRIKLAEQRIEQKIIDAIDDEQPGACTYCGEPEEAPGAGVCWKCAARE